MNTLINHIIDQLHIIQDGRPWVGSSYARKLRGIEDEQVFVRPIAEMHSIAEIISHLSFWRKEAILKIKTGDGGKTDDCEENWLTNEELKPKGWAAIKSEYDNSLLELIDLLKEKDDTFLDETYYDNDFKGTYTYRFLIDGVLHHDVYHLGQLGIIVKYLQKTD